MSQTLSSDTMRMDGGDEDRAVLALALPLPASRRAVPPAGTQHTPLPPPCKKPLFGGLQHNPLILWGALKGKTVVMFQKPEEVWGKGAGS